MSITQAMTGLATLGGALQSPTPEQQGHAIVAVLTGQQDENLLHGLYFRQHRKVAANDDQLRSAENMQMLQRVKDQLRSMVQRHFDDYARHVEMEKQQNLHRVQQELAASNRPDKMGTVAEIAARYDISKSEVRRLRAAGLLHTLKAQHDQ